MKRHNNTLLTPEEYSANREMGMISEGYIENIGYAFHTFGYIPAANQNGYRNHGTLDTETCFYSIVHGQGLDHTPKAISASRRVAASAAATPATANPLKAQKNPQKPKKPKAEKPDPYQDNHTLAEYSLDEFLEANRGKSYFEIINQRGKSDGMPGGPAKRMVRNPNDNKLMDMRHVMVVGYGATAFSSIYLQTPLPNYVEGNLLGLGVEILQWLGPLVGKDSGDSAFNLQDFYSNNIGAQFFSHRVKDSILNDKDWATSFVEWLKGQGK